ncbi:MAG: esterase/lipase family protein [Niabella sp.]
MDGKDKKTWENFLPNFQSKSVSGYTDYWTFGYNSSYSILQNAQILANLLKANSNGATIDIVAHSMGGLVARSAIEDFGSDSYV